MARGWIASEEGAERESVGVGRIRAVLVEAVLKLCLRTNGANHTLDVDIVIVHRSRDVAEQRHREVRLQHKTACVGIGALLRQVRIAAGEFLNLSVGRLEAGDHRGRRALRQAEGADGGGVHAVALAGRAVDVAGIAGAEARGRRRADGEETVAGGREQFTYVRRADGARVAAAQQQPIEHLPLQVGLIGIDGVNGLIIRVAAAQVEVDRLGKGQVFHDRNQKLAVQLIYVDVAADRLRTIEADHAGRVVDEVVGRTAAGVAVDRVIGRRQQGVRQERRAVVAVVGAEGEAHVAAHVAIGEVRRREQLALEVAFHNPLRVLRLILRLGAEETGARCGDLTDAKGVVSRAGAVTRRSRVHEHCRRVGVADVAELRVGLVVMSVGGVDIVGDIVERNVTFHADDRLVGLGLVLRDAGAELAEALGEHERSVRVGTRVQDGAQVAGNERVAGADQEARTARADRRGHARRIARGRRGGELGRRRIVGEQELRIGLHMRRNRIFQVRESVVARQRRQNVVQRAGVVAAAVGGSRQARDSGEVNGGRAAVVGSAIEQRAVVVRRKRVGRLNASGRRSGDAVAGEQVGDRRLGGQVGAEEGDAALRSRAGQAGHRQDARIDVAADGREVAARHVRARTIEHRVGIGVAQADHGIAAVVGKVRAGGDVDVLRLCIALVRHAVLRVDHHALKVVLQLEIGNAGQGVRTVGCGLPSRHDLDILDQGLWDVVDVDNAARVRGRDAAAVEQHEVTLRAQAAQVDVHLAVSGVVVLAAKVAHELRDFAEQGVQRGRARVLDRLGADGDDGAVGHVVAAGDARSGDHHFADLGARVARGVEAARVRDLAGGGLSLALGLGGGRFDVALGGLRGLGEGRSGGEEGGARQEARRQEAAARGGHGRNGPWRSGGAWNRRGGDQGRATNLSSSPQFGQSAAGSLQCVVAFLSRE